MSASIRISIRRADQEVAAVVAGPTPVKIGRSKQCDIVLDDAAVSRVHAILTIEGNDAVLTDQASQNGLWVRGTRTSRIVLDPSVVVAMGPFRIVCEAATGAAGDQTILRPAAKPSNTPTPPSGVAATGASSSPTVVPVTAKTKAVTPVSPSPPPGDASRVPPPAAPSGPGMSSTQSMVLLAIAAVLMVAIGGGLTAVWLKYRAGSNQAGGDAAADTQASASSITTTTTTTTTSAPVTETPVPPPADGSQATAPPTTTTSVAPVPPTSAPASAPPTSAVAPTSAPAAGTATADPSAGTPPPGTPGGTTPTSAAPQTLPAGIVAAGRRPRESNAAWVKRSTDLTRRLNQGRTALEKGDFDSAIDTLTALQRDEPNFGDAAALLIKAREGVKASAQTLVAEGQDKERKEDFAGAIESYQKAEKIDPELSARVAQAIAGARARWKALIDDLYTKARSSFALRRPDALPLHQRLAKLMPEDDPRRAEIQTKLTQLQGGKQ